MNFTHEHFASVICSPYTSFHGMRQVMLIHAVTRLIYNVMLITPLKDEELARLYKDETIHL